MGKVRHKLCPVCRRAYYRLQIADNGDLFYVHYEGVLDGEPHAIACQITDNSEIRGVPMRSELFKRRPKRRP